MSETVNQTMDDAGERDAARLGARLGRARYAAAQGLRSAWYAGHYALTRRMSGPVHRPGEERFSSSAQPASRDEVWRAFLEPFEKDRAAIEAGLYPAPRDLDPRRLAAALANSRRYFQDVRAVDQRRLDRRGGEVQERPDADPSRYPAYYLQNFHFQTDGWLSRESAQRYDTQVEVLFSGAADAMRRLALAAIGAELRQRDQRSARLLDVACGTGRFLAQTLDAFPRLQASGLDLSPAYLEEAAERLKPWPHAELMRGDAAAIPADDASFDMLATVYLFHELPPKVRRQAASEFVRVLKPGGLLIFADSIQWGDSKLDALLDYFPEGFHEPFYRSYLAEDLDALFAEAATAEGATLTLQSADQAFLTKTRVYRKG